MAGKRRSLQDHIRNRQQSGFVGRQGQLVQYQENLSFPVDDERRQFLFNIHGDAGVGKTYLTKQLQRIAIGSGGLTAYVDETVDDATLAMSVIAEEFGRSGARLSEFEKRAAAYRERRHELESDPKAPEGFATFLTKTAVTIGLAAARDVPFAGSLLAPVDPAATADQVDQARRYLAGKFSNHADVKLLLSPADELTPIFVSEINRVAADRPIALFFDTYERTGLVLDRWLRSLYAEQYGGLPETLITTISGQNSLNSNLWGEYLPVIADISLEPFSETEARQFLASKDIHDESTIQVILTLSGCLPMWLATLAEARPSNAADVGDPAGDAVERFLKWEHHPARRNIALTAALPRTLNQDVLTTIAAAEDGRELFDWLRRLPFVTRRAGSWAYHEVVRAAMLRLQLAQAPNEWRSNQIVLAQANQRWAREAEGTDKTWRNPAWIDYTREETYHRLCADPINNLPEALASAVYAGAHSTIRARQWARLITDAGRDTGNQTLRQWGQRLRGSIDDRDLTQYFTSLISDADLDRNTQAIALGARGAYRQLTHHYDDALADLDRAIELAPDKAQALAARGEVYRLTERNDAALRDLNRVIELDPSIGTSVIGRAAIYARMKRFDDAVADANRVIELYPNMTHAAVFRGAVYQLLKRYDDALTDFNRAIELDPDNTMAIASRGEVHRLTKRYDDALTDFNRAIELDPDNTMAIASRGEVHRLTKRYDDALTDFNRAIELDPDNTKFIASRGEVYRLTERYDDALTDFNRAIELDPDNAKFIASRGEVYRLTERYDDALTDFNRAIELDPDNAKFIAYRAVIYVLTERYDDALTELSRAIELTPANALGAAARGGVYRLLERYDDALADFNRAIELDPDDAEAIASRGEVYKQTELYDDALADFNRAIELDPDNAEVIASRSEVYRLMERDGTPNDSVVQKAHED